jgi:hypothetical protein
MLAQDTKTAEQLSEVDTRLDAHHTRLEVAEEQMAAFEGVLSSHQVEVTHELSRKANDAEMQEQVRVLSPSIERNFFASGV